jgi:acetylornithine deacetylase/succinyl-diaminopimelate desuccinylase-like protein
MAPPPLDPVVLRPLEATVHSIWGAVPVMPIMEAGASDSIYTMNAGIPSYGICGVAVERADDKAHGRDERLKIDAYYTGVEFYYLFLKGLTTPAG